MRLFILFLIIHFFCFTGMAQVKNKSKEKSLPKITQKKKAEYLKYLKDRCIEAQKNKRAMDKTSQLCGCYSKELSKLTGKQLQHLVLADHKKGNLSQLSIDDAQQLEDYDFQIASKCMGDDLSKPKKKKK